MYLEYLINESAVQEEIKNNEETILNKFKETFSIDNIYEEVSNNLNALIEKDNISKTYENIVNFSKTYTLDYLIKTTDSLA